MIYLYGISDETSTQENYTGKDEREKNNIPRVQIFFVIE